MLNENDFKLIEKQASKLYGNLELEIIQEMAERIANVGYANTVVYNNAVILQEMGVLYEDIINIDDKYNETNASEIREIFKNAGIKSLERDDTIYKLAGLTPKGLNTEMVQLLEATAEKTGYNLERLTNTIASTSQIQFIEAMNTAYMEVSTGTKSYSQSILDAIKNVSNKGAQVEYPSGYKLSVESAIRMNILTGVNQCSSKLQLLRGKELGWDLYEVSAHSGARPEHAEWQGKVYTEQQLYDVCEYGSVTGLCGANCHHTFKPYYKGSSLTYSKSELEKFKNETVEYNGKKISKYDATQMQRRMERQIRQDKKDIAGLQGILTSNAADNKLIEETRTQFAKKTLYYKEHLNVLNDFTEQTFLKMDNTRLMVNNFGNSRIGSITKIVNKYNNSDIIGTKVNGIEVKEIGEHVISRTYGKKVKVEDVENTLKNPIKYGKIRKDNSQQINGENCTVVMNMQTGKLITVYPKKTKRND